MKYQDKKFKILLTEFDEKMAQFFSKAERARRILNEISAESRKRFLVSKRNSSIIK